MAFRRGDGESGDLPGEADAVTLFQVAGTDENRLGLIMFNQANQDLGPQRSREFEAGFDGSMFNGGLAYTVTGYRQETFDGRIFINPPPSNGIAENIPLNVGNHESKGIETSVDVAAYEGENVRFSVNGSYQFNSMNKRMYRVHRLIAPLALAAGGVAGGCADTEILGVILDEDVNIPEIMIGLARGTNSEFGDIFLASFAHYVLDAPTDALASDDTSLGDVDLTVGDHRVADEPCASASEIEPLAIQIRSARTAVSDAWP